MFFTVVPLAMLTIQIQSLFTAACLETTKRPRERACLKCQGSLLTAADSTPLGLTGKHTTVLVWMITGQQPGYITTEAESNIIMGFKDQHTWCFTADRSAVVVALDWLHVLAAADVGRNVFIVNCFCAIFVYNWTQFLWMYFSRVTCNYLLWSLKIKYPSIHADAD